jgi:hypothetical protein
MHDSVIECKVVQLVLKQGSFEQLVYRIDLRLEFEELFFGTNSKLDKIGLISFFRKDAIKKSLIKDRLFNFSIAKEHADQQLIGFIEGVEQHLSELNNHTIYL